MLALHRRLAIAGVITATAIAVPAGALASGSGSPSGPPSGKSGPPQACISVACRSKTRHAAAARPPLAALAASAGISTDRLEAGLEAAKRGGGNASTIIAAFAASAGVSHATAQRVISDLFGGRVIPRGVTGPPTAARTLATRLGVSLSAAGRTFKEITALSSQNGGVNPASSAFAAIARDLGVSPARLAAAWHAVGPSPGGQSAGGK